MSFGTGWSFRFGMILSWLCVAVGHVHLDTQSRRVDRVSSHKRVLLRWENDILELAIVLRFKQLRRLLSRFLEVGLKEIIPRLVPFELLLWLPFWMSIPHSLLS